MQIDDGKGKNGKAGVNPDQRLEGASTSVSMEHYINHVKGDAYSLSFEQAPTANDDCIVYVSNSSETDMVMEGIRLSVSVACEVYFKISAKGTRNAATAIVPVNSNGKSGKEADGTFEKGADLDGGAATLTNGLEVDRAKFGAVPSVSPSVNFEQDFIVPKNGTFTVWCDTAGATVLGTLFFNYHNGDLD